jgi:hypothetical protein
VQVLVGKPEGRRALGRPRFRWKDTIKIDLLEVVCGTWTGLMRCRCPAAVNAAVNFCVV